MLSPLSRCRTSLKLGGGLEDLWCEWHICTLTTYSARNQGQQTAWIFPYNPHHHCSTDEVMKIQNILASHKVTQLHLVVTRRSMSVSCHQSLGSSTMPPRPSGNTGIFLFICLTSTPNGCSFEDFNLFHPEMLPQSSFNLHFLILIENLNLCC